MLERRCGESTCPFDEAALPARSRTYPIDRHLRTHVPAIEGPPIRARTVFPGDSRVPGRLLRGAALPPRVPEPHGHHPGNPLPSLLVRAHDDGGRRLVGHRRQRRKVRPRLRGRVRGRGRVRRRRGRALPTFDDYYSELTLEFLVAAVAFLSLV